jgi:hypothetical protein
MLFVEESVIEDRVVRISWICRKRMIASIGDFKKAIGEAGLSELMGSEGHAMCIHCSLLRSLQWGASGALFPISQSTPR